jgi:hypothetical protein
MVTCLQRLIGGALLSISLILSTQARAELKIINGVSALPDSWPFMVSLFTTNQGSPVTGHFCGGTLVSDRHVLTAAHCVAAYRDSPGKIKATIGRLRLSQAGTSVTAAINKVTIHPEFQQEKSLAFDVAILELKTPVNIAPITHFASPSTDSATFGTSLTILGWGTMDGSLSVRPDILQQASIPRMDNRTCGDRLGLDFKQETMLCAGVLASNPTARDGVDACYGDSGGPLIGYIDGHPAVVGITSWGYSCGSDRYWGVYTKVAAFSSWIRNIISGTPENLRAPSIATIKRSPRILRCLPGRWNTPQTNSKVTIRWYRADGSLVGNRPTYQLKPGDYGESFQCEVTVAITGSQGKKSSSSRSLPSAVFLPKFTPVPDGGSIVGSARSCTSKDCRIFIKVAAPFVPSSLTATTASSCSSGNCSKRYPLQNVRPTVGMVQIPRATKETVVSVESSNEFSASQKPYSVRVPGRDRRG